MVAGSTELFNTNDKRLAIEKKQKLLQYEFNYNFNNPRLN
jgi:hypothetical protein